MEGEPELVNHENLEEIRKRRLAYFQANNLESPLQNDLHAEQTRDIVEQNLPKQNSDSFVQIAQENFTSCDHHEIPQSIISDVYKIKSQQGLDERNIDKSQVISQNFDSISRNEEIRDSHFYDHRHSNKNQHSHLTDKYDSGDDKFLQSHDLNINTDSKPVPDYNHRQSQLNHFENQITGPIINEKDTYEDIHVRSICSPDLPNRHAQNKKIIQGNSDKKVHKSLSLLLPRKSNEPQKSTSTVKASQHYDRSVEDSYEFHRNKQILKSVEDAFDGDLDEDVRNQILRISLKDTTDFDELGLSPHQPDVIPSNNLKKEGNKKSPFDQNLPGQLKQLLGPEKYKEFVEKSKQDIASLYKEKGKNQDMSSETIPDENLTHSQKPKSSTHPQKMREDSLNPSSKEFQPRLHRAKTEPMHIDNMTFRSNSELQANSSLSSHRNYDQITVNAGTNFAYSLDEIYNQAYNAKQNNVSHSQQFPVHQPYMDYRQYQQLQQMPTSSSVPVDGYTLYSPVPPGGISHEHFQPAFYGAPPYMFHSSQHPGHSIPTSPGGIPQTPLADPRQYTDYRVPQQTPLADPRQYPDYHIPQTPPSDSREHHDHRIPRMAPSDSKQYPDYRIPQTPPSDSRHHDYRIPQMSQSDSRQYPDYRIPQTPPLDSRQYPDYYIPQMSQSDPRQHPDYRIPQTPSSNSRQHADQPMYYSNVHPYQMNSGPVHLPQPPSQPHNSNKTSPRLDMNAAPFVPHPPVSLEKHQGPRRRSFQEGLAGRKNASHTSEDVSQKENGFEQRNETVNDRRRSSFTQEVEVADFECEPIIKDSKVNRHIDGVRKCHEEGREINLNDNVDQQKQKSYAHSSLNRYFTSLEDCYTKFEKRHTRKSLVKNPKTHFQSSVEMAYTDDDTISAVDTDLTMVTYKDDNEIAELGDQRTEKFQNKLSYTVDAKNKDALALSASNEDTKSAVTMTSVKAAGLTERMEELGIEVDLKGGEDNSELSRKLRKKFVKICPECGIYNKKYMSWCVECGEVLMGVDPVYVGKKPLPDNKITSQHNKAEITVDEYFKGNHDKVLVKDDEDEKGYFSSSPVHRPAEMELPHTDFSPNVDSRDSGRASSGENREDGNFTTSTKEVTEICQLIEDPVIKGYIKSYFTDKNNTRATIQKHAELSVDHKTPDCFKRSHKSRISPRNNHDNKRHLENKEHKSSSLNDDPVMLKNVSELGEAVDESENTTPIQVNKNNETKSNTKFKRSHKTKTKYKNNENVDVEIFARNEPKSVTPTSLVVPSLNLATSSDDEEKKNRKKDHQKSLESDSSSDWEEFFVPKKQGSLSPSMESIAAADHELPENESRPFLAHLVDEPSLKSNKKPLRRPLSAGRKKYEKKEVESRVRQSVPHQRHWARSSTAWSSSNRTETRQRNYPAHTRDNRPQSGHSENERQNQRATSARDSRRSSSHNENLPDSKKPRPASADLYKRKQQFQSLPHANKNVDMVLTDRFDDENEIPSCSNIKTKADRDSPDDVVAHRLPVNDVMPMLGPDPHAAASTYRTYYQLTPRIQGGQFSRWLCLPDELWLHILSYLQHSDLIKCAQACQRLHRVSMDEFLWRYITVKKRDMNDNTLQQVASHHPVSLALIKCHGDDVTTPGLQALFQECGTTLRELNFSGCSRGSLTGDNILMQASSRCCNLTHIDTSWCSISDYGLLAITNGCDRLESVCMNGCQMVTDMSFENLLKKHGSSLRILEMFGCFNITPKGLRAIGQMCSNLLTLNLGQCYKFTSDPHPFSSECRKLPSKWILGIPYGKFFLMLTDSCIIQISANLSRVENLDLRGCKQIKDTCVRKIVRNCPRLRMLAFANCPHISDSAILEVATYLPDIRILDVCGCKNITDVSIRALANNCHNIKNLDISSTGCTHRSISVLSNFSNRTLEILKINFLTDVSEAIVIKLAKHCRRLRILHMYGCSSIKNTIKIRSENRNLRVES